MVELIETSDQGMLDDYVSGPVEKFNQHGQEVVKSSDFDPLIGTILAKGREPRVVGIVVQ